jgi:predicted RNA polymerase sigma factor
MAAEPAYRIDIEERDLVVRVRADLLGREEVSKFLDYLELESTRRRSSLSEEDATALAEEVDRSVWDRVRSHVSGQR